MVNLLIRRNLGKGHSLFVLPTAVWLFPGLLTLRKRCTFGYCFVWGCAVRWK